jgi:putative transposase
MQEYLDKYTLALMCRALNVSRSGYYRWLNAPQSYYHQKRQSIESVVIEHYQKFKKRYGVPRITQELNVKGLSCSLNYIAKLIRVNGLKARNGKSFRHGRTPENVANVSRNLLKRDLKADQPNRKWTSDITYIRVNEKWLYLATVMDLYSRKIVGWSLDTSMTEALISKALSMGFQHRDVEPGLIVHSDRGVQYRAHNYRRLIKKEGGHSSINRSGNCWDNTPMESFFSRHKLELIYAEKFSSISEAKSSIFEYIEIFYNRVRRHSALGYIRTAEFERIGA